MLLPKIFKGFFAHRPPRKTSLSEGLLTTSVGLEASTHHPTTPIQATTGEMFQTHPKRGFNKIASACFH
jgi:hypothetical protein